MSISKERKLINLLNHWPLGHIATPTWLKEMGVSNQLIQQYVRSGWAESLGKNAYKRKQDTVFWYTALADLQYQTGLPAHIGGPSTFDMRGQAHYIRSKQASIYLFSPPNHKLPKWFSDHQWERSIHHIKTGFLPTDLGISEYDYQGIKLKISSSERAILECLYLAPDQFDLIECAQLIEGLRGLRPDMMQKLLECCCSIKVKRLFLYLADRATLPVLKFLKLEQIDLGHGARSIVPGGIYVAKYWINVPKELEYNV